MVEKVLGARIAMQKALGGHKQRQAQAQVAQPGSALVASLVKEWAWLRIPTELVQKFTQAGLQDLRATSPHVGGQRAHQELEALASVGAMGSQTGNVYRDLIGKLAPSHFPEPC